MDEKKLPELTTPSRKAIAKATGVALAVALLLLFTAVLPAEYGVDPLKTGAALGLIGLSKSGDSNRKGRATATPAPGQTSTSPRAAPSS